MITQKRLKELLHYDAEAGVFTWLVNRGPVKVGDIAGTITHGYIIICVDCVAYRAHRLARLYETGFFPENTTDHENHIKTDNRFVNISDKTQKQNLRNQSIRSNNSSGVLGVVWHKKACKWMAQIMVDGKNKYLGLFETIEDASEARQSANRKYGFHENHGMAT